MSTFAEKMANLNAARAAKAGGTKAGGAKAGGTKAGAAKPSADGFVKIPIKGKGKRKRKGKGKMPTLPPAELPDENPFACLDDAEMPEGRSVGR
jgi:hypothetical protein